MQIDRNFFLTIGVSLGIMFAWMFFFGPKNSDAPPAPTTSQPATPPSNAPVAPTAAAAAAPLAPSVKKPQSRPAALTHVIEHPGFSRITMSTWGAAATDWQLLDPRYQENGEAGKTRPINFVGTKLPELPFALSSWESDFSLERDAAWMQLPSASPDELNYAWDDARVRVEKHFRFLPDSYQVDLTLVVENRSPEPVNERLVLDLYGFQDPNAKTGGTFSRAVIETEGVCNVDGKVHRSGLKGLLEKDVDQAGAVHFFGIDQKYFLAALAVRDKEALRCLIKANSSGTISSTLVLPKRRLGIQERAEFHLVGFFGPKVLHDLEAVKVNGEDSDLGKAINYGMFELLARPMLLVLKAIHAVIPNWGLAIILVTMLIKAVTWWPTMKSMRSMKEMGKLKPEMEALKKRYGSDQQNINKETMALYKKHGINPLGGCLPMAIQMPIYIALYSMLQNAVELYRSSFIFWIHDLTAPDPYYVLPLFSGALMLIQQLRMPTSSDPQQKMMMYTMPVMMTVFGVFFPAGLNVYMATNSLLGFAQQLWMNRNEPKRK